MRNRFGWKKGDVVFKDDPDFEDSPTDAAEEVTRAEKATGTWFEQSMRALPGRFGPALDDEDTK
jgi:hypothetical protein